MIIFSFDYSGVTQLEIPTELESFLGDESIEKCGVQIKGDVTRVRKQYNVVTRGVVELKELARKLSSVPNKAKDTVSFRLAELVKRFLHCTLPKPNDLNYVKPTESDLSRKLFDLPIGRFGILNCTQSKKKTESKISVVHVQVDVFE